MNKFTLGQWTIEGPRQGSLGAALGISIFSVDHTEPICRVWGYLHDVEANAQLIAAAPDMLEALEKIGFYPALSPLDPLSALDDMRQIAQAAIGGATKESE